MDMKLMTCRHHLHLNLTRQGHTISINLNMPSLFEFAPIAYLCAFLVGILTLAPETAEETYVELSDTEPEDTVGAASTTLPGKGGLITLPYSFPLTLLSYSLRTVA